MNRKIICAIFASMLFVSALYAHEVSVSFYMGKVSLSRKGASIPIRNGLSIKSGDIITTGKGGLVELIYNDKSSVIIREQSRVRIGSTSIDGSLRPALILGSITGKFSKLKRGSHKIYCPTAVCAVRGTEFTVIASEAADSRVDVKEGVVSVENSFGEATVKKGETAEADASEKPVKEKQGAVKGWLTDKEKNLEKDPGTQAEKIEDHLEAMQKKGKERISARDLKKSLKKADSKEDLQKVRKKIDRAEKDAEDDIMQAQTMAESLDILASNFKRRKNKIYREFELLKKKSDKVSRVKEQNLKNLNSVKDDFNRAWERIKKDYADDSKDFIKEADMDKVKPEIKKYEVEKYDIK